MTKDAEKFLCICYRDYLSRVKDGNSKSDSRRFSKTIKMKTPILPIGTMMILLKHAANLNVSVF